MACLSHARYLLCLTPCCLSLCCVKLLQCPGFEHFDLEANTGQLLAWVFLWWRYPQAMHMVMQVRHVPLIIGCHVAPVAQLHQCYE